jgi:hypothetical protein
MSDDMDALLDAVKVTPAMMERLITLLSQLLGPLRSLLTTRFEETPLLPISEEECERLLYAASQHLFGAPSLGLALGLGKLDALGDYLEFVTWYMRDVRIHIEQMRVLYEAGAPALAVQAREVFIEANAFNANRFVGHLMRYLSVREDNATLKYERAGGDDLEVQTLRAERELLLSGQWGSVAYWEQLFSMMDVDLTELLPPNPPAD